MTDFPTASEPATATPTPVSAPPEAAPAAAEPVAASDPAPVAPPPEAVVRAPRSGGRRHGRGSRPQPAAPSADAPAAGARAARPVPPVLEQLAELYPGLFGAVFLPLKRGIFEDLMQAHPQALDREALKAGLAIHTRSTRYLQSVAAGLQRHDLAGQAVEAMAPEHVHHALMEVFRRRQTRGGDDLRAKLVQRLVQAFEASGLSRDDYEARVRGRDEAANALLDEALAEAAARRAKDEALLRAFEGGGQAVAAFAAMYGLDPRVAAQVLERARHRRSLAAGR
jgi:ProP effector